MTAPARTLRSRPGPDELVQRLVTWTLVALAVCLVGVGVSIYL